MNRSLFVPAEKMLLWIVFFFSPHIHCGWFTFWENSAFFTVQGETKRVLFWFPVWLSGFSYTLATVHPERLLRFNKRARDLQEVGFWHRWFVCVRTGQSVPSSVRGLTGGKKKGEQGVWVWSSSKGELPVSWECLTDSRGGRKYL